MSNAFMSDVMQAFPLTAPAFNGNSRVIAAGNGFEWLQQGWAIFRVNPGLWVAISLLLLLGYVALNIVSLVGPLAAHLLTPVFAAGLLSACRKASESGERGEGGETNEKNASHESREDESSRRFVLEDVFAGFKRNTNNLVILGVIYMGVLLLLDILVALLLGGSALGGMVMGGPVGLGVLLGGSLLALLFRLALVVPVTMAMWFAPALVFFNNMAPLDALKASFNACLKNTLPFLVYGLMVMVLLFFAALPVGLGFLVLLPVLCGSIYVSYRDIYVAN
jgi:uncharacterized membrane protein